MNCHDHDDKERAKVCVLNTAFCVFEHQQNDPDGPDRDCAEHDDIKLKNFYGIGNGGCVICNGPGNCEDPNVEDDPGELDMNEMKCFCNKDNCNQNYDPKTIQWKETEMDFGGVKKKVGKSDFADQGNPGGQQPAGPKPVIGGTCGKSATSLIMLIMLTSVPFFMQPF